MKKPTFLDCPPRYTRTPRTGQSDAHKACSVERYAPTHRNDKIVMWACALALVALLGAIAVGSVQ